MDELLAAIRNYLGVTWMDGGTDDKLMTIIGRGKAYLDKIAGEPLDYSMDGTARGLLFDYVRYDYAGASQDFPNDFLTELNGLNVECEVRRHEAEFPDF